MPGIVSRARDSMTKVLNICLMIAVGLLVASVVWGVFTRELGRLIVHLHEAYSWEPYAWLPTGQTKWTEELARFLLIWVSFLGGAVAFGTRSHLGVDFFVGKFDPSARKLMSIVAHIIVLIFASAVFLYGGGCIVLKALAMNQMTPALGWKMGHVYLALPIAGFFMVIYTIENMIIDIKTPLSKLYENDGKED